MNEPQQNTTPEKSLYEQYNALFECVIADSDDLIDECYRLRYKVYCVENPLKEPDPEEGEYERDEYDGHAMHALLRYRRTGEHIGTVRLIFNEGDSPHKLPFFKLAEENHIFLPEHFGNQPIAEISRFCISKEFRRRLTDHMYSTVYTPVELTEAPGRTIPYMAIGLISMVYRMARAQNIRQCCAVMEPSLMRLFKKLGIHYQPIGPLVEYYGQRQLTHITSADMIKTLTAERPDVLELITDRGRFSD